MQQYIFEIPYTEPEKTFSIFAESDGAVFLDSSDLNNPSSRFSFIGFSPFETLIRRQGKTEITNKEFSLYFRGNVFDVIKKRLSAISGLTKMVANPPLPFTNGAAGFFSYDLGRSLERMPYIATDDLSMPDLSLGIYDQVIGFDLLKKKSWLCLICTSDAQAKTRLDFIKAKLDNFRYILPNSFKPEWERLKSRHDFKNDIARVISYIHAGDIFQANLAQTFRADIPDYFNPYAHYLNLRKINPAPFSAYFKMSDFVLSSSSPERFLKVTDRHVETRPIKGTLSDSEDKEKLRNSEKDRAENIMIIDLMRNDLSKICEAHSVQATQICEIESFSGLHHLVSTVEGELQKDKHAIDVISACFPGGSITGAPKIRAMEIIEELEPVRRGAYCGAIGYIDFNGNMDLNIAIRTLTYKGNIVSLSVGGGIVADSDPEAEYQETLLKARKMFESFETVQERQSIRVAEIA